MDYRSVRPDLGTIDDLRALTTTLRGDGISLCLDLVLNHVAREHEWAVAARAGDAEKRAYFHVYDDRSMPDAYEASLPEVFPDFAPGNFTWDDDLAAWVWTTFNDYQWDVDWSNPSVLCEYADIILNLANLGVEVFRLDAIAFIWKRMGTACQNQPEVHELTRALRTVARIAAPAVVFKAEAIVGPRRPAGLPRGRPARRPGQRPGVPQRADGADLVDAGHRRRAAGGPGAPAAPAAAARPRRGSPTCAATTTSAGRSPTRTPGRWGSTRSRTGASSRTGTPARSRGRGPAGLVFQQNEQTGDRRISGSLASLAGLEAGDPDAAARILLAHALILGFGGVPVIWMGDELGLLNDRGMGRRPRPRGDNRWVHRPRMPWRAVAAGTDEHGISAGLRELVEARRSLPHLHAASPTEVWDPRDPGVLLVVRKHPVGPLLGAYNVTAEEAWVAPDVLHWLGLHVRRSARRDQRPRARPAGGRGQAGAVRRRVAVRQRAALTVPRLRAVEFGVLVVLLFGAFVLVAFIAAIASHRAAQKRRQDLAVRAGQRGWTFVERDDQWTRALHRSAVRARARTADPQHPGRAVRGPWVRRVRPHLLHDRALDERPGASRDPRAAATTTRSSPSTPVPRSRRCRWRPRASSDVWSAG